MFRRSVLTATTVALLVAGCTQQEASSPVTDDPTTGAATVSTLPADTVPVASAPTVSSDPAPPATEPAISVPEVSAESTTPPAESLPGTTLAPVPSGEPTNIPTPIFAGSDIEPWLYIGQWDGTAWAGAFDVDDQAIVAPTDEGGAISTVGIDNEVVDATIGVNGESCFDGRVGPAIAPGVSAPEVPGFGYSTVALTADWPLTPRRAVQVDADVPEFAAAGRTAFAGDDVETQAGEVDQIVVADLDGDGDTEALVVFGDEAQTALVEPGYSGLLLVDTDSGAATTIVKSFSPLSGAAGDSATSEPATSDAPSFAPFDSYRVLAVADLDGDGFMEIVVHSWYFEGAGVNVYTYDGTTVTEVLSTGCGA